MRPAPVLPYITWGLIQEPQNKRGIPDKIYTVIKIKRNFREKIINTNYNRKKEKGGRYFIKNIYEEDNNK